MQVVYKIPHLSNFPRDTSGPYPDGRGIYTGIRPEYGRRDSVDDKEIHSKDQVILFISIYAHLRSFLVGL